MACLSFVSIFDGKYFLSLRCYPGERVDVKKKAFSNSLIVVNY